MRCWEVQAMVTFWFCPRVVWVHLDISIFFSASSSIFILGFLPPRNGDFLWLASLDDCVLINWVQIYQGAVHFAFLPGDDPEGPDILDGHHVNVYFDILLHFFFEPSTVPHHHSGDCITDVVCPHKHGWADLLCSEMWIYHSWDSIYKKHSEGVLRHVIAGRVDGVLPHWLGDQKEVVPLWQSHHVVHHGAAGRIGGLAAGLEEPGVDAVTVDDVGELQIVLVDNLRIGWRVLIQERQKPSLPW